jgi:hypothetical protein
LEKSAEKVPWAAMGPFFIQAAFKSLVFMGSSELHGLV